MNFVAAMIHNLFPLNQRYYAAMYYMKKLKNLISTQLYKTIKLNIYNYAQSLDLLFPLV